MRRRHFLAGAGACAALGVLDSPLARGAGAQTGRGRVLQVKDRKVSAPDGLLDEARVTRLVDWALMAWTGDEDPVDALRRFVSPSDTVGIKLNCMGCPKLAVKPAVTARLLELLEQGGVAASRTIVYDQFGFRLIRAGYELADDPKGVQVVHAKSKGWGYGSKRHTYDATRTFAWSRLLERCTAIINVCVPKDHALCGVSGALKNLAMGLVDRPFVFHPVLDAAIPRIFGRAELGSRVRLHLCDATRVQWHGGPQDNPVHSGPYGSLLLANDPVALDWTIVDIVNRLRRRRRLAELHDVKLPRKRPPTHVANAAVLGLGAPAGEVVRIKLDVDGGRDVGQLRNTGDVEPSIDR